MYESFYYCQTNWQAICFSYGHIFCNVAVSNAWYLYSLIGLITILETTRGLNMFLANIAACTALLREVVSSSQGSSNSGKGLSNFVSFCDPDRQHGGTNCSFVSLFNHIPFTEKMLI